MEKGGLDTLKRQQRVDLMEDRRGNGSIIITSQLPSNHWHEKIGAPSTG